MFLNINKPSPSLLLFYSSWIIFKLPSCLRISQVDGPRYIDKGAPQSTTNVTPMHFLLFYTLYRAYLTIILFVPPIITNFLISSGFKGFRSSGWKNQYHSLGKSSAPKAI